MCCTGLLTVSKVRECLTVQLHTNWFLLVYPLIYRNLTYRLLVTIVPKRRSTSYQHAGAPGTNQSKEGRQWPHTGDLETVWPGPYYRIFLSTLVPANEVHLQWLYLGAIELKRWSTPSPSQWCLNCPPIITEAISKWRDWRSGTHASCPSVLSSWDAIENRRGLQALITPIPTDEVHHQLFNDITRCPTLGALYYTRRQLKTLQNLCR